MIDIKWIPSRTSCWYRAGGKFAAKPPQPLWLSATDGHIEALRQRQIDAERRQREEYWRSREIESARDTIELARIELGIDDADASPEQIEAKEREIDDLWRAEIAKAQEKLETLLGETDQ